MANEYIGERVMKRSKPRTGYLMKTANGFRARFRVAGKSVYYPLNSTDKLSATREMDGIAARLNGDTAQVIDNLRGLLARLEGVGVDRSLPMDQAWERYDASTTRPLSSPQTLNAYRSHWNDFSRWCGRVGIADLARVDDASAKMYVHSMESAGITSCTTRGRVAFLRMMWKHVMHGSANPWESARVRRIDSSVVKRPFTLDHLRLILNSAPDGEWRDVMWLLAYTGMRVGDACTARCEWVMFERGVIEFLPAKTGKRGERPMAARVGIHKAIDSMLRMRVAGRKSGYLFPGLAADYSTTPTYICDRFRVYLAGLGFDTQVRREGVKRSACVFGWHSFRHALQSRLADIGYGGLVADQILCHKQSGSLGQHYTHISDAVLVEAINRSMPDLLEERGVVIQMGSVA